MAALSESAEVLGPLSSEDPPSISMPSAPAEPAAWRSNSGDIITWNVRGEMGRWCEQSTCGRPGVHARGTSGDVIGTTYTDVKVIKTNNNN